jgi:hypothetical protein
MLAFFRRRRWWALRLADGAMCPAVSQLVIAYWSWRLLAAVADGVAMDAMAVAFHCAEDQLHLALLIACCDDGAWAFDLGVVGACVACGTS